MPSREQDTQPLLQSDNANAISNNHKKHDSSTTTTGKSPLRRTLQWFLASKYGHYFVIGLVSLDVAGIFANFLISLHMCEHSHDDLRTWEAVNKILGVISLVFSCFFVVELIASVYAFGLRYFTSAFHVFDATSIMASFFVDVLTHGPVEEAGSLIIVLRLFRVFKIIEESSTVAEEEMSELKAKVVRLEKENGELRRRTGGETAVGGSRLEEEV